MKHMTLSEFIDSESDEPVFIVDGPQPVVGTACIETAKQWRKLAEHDHHYIKAVSIQPLTWEEYVRAFAS